MLSRTDVANICACTGVVLVVIAGVWELAAALMTGLALLVVSHALAPCLDRIAVWRKKLLK
jgi:hypothetical protein